jgi:BlaI family penicillinase repressor
MRSIQYRPRRLVMKEYKLTESEEKFANIIWLNEPIASGDLVKLSEKEMNWKKSTTYTVLKKLCEKGIFKNENAVVSSLITKNEYYAKQSILFVEDTFGGSLPRFLTAFIGEKKLSKKQAEELKRLIDKHKEV